METPKTILIASVAHVTHGPHTCHISQIDAQGITGYNDACAFFWPWKEITSFTAQPAHLQWLKPTDTAPFPGQDCLLLIRHKATGTIEKVIGYRSNLDHYKVEREGDYYRLTDVEVLGFLPIPDDDATEE